MKDPNKTTTEIYRKDLDYLARIKKKQGLNGKSDVLRRMIKLMKEMKWENELK